MKNQPDRVICGAVGIYTRTTTRPSSLLAPAGSRASASVPIIVRYYKGYALTRHPMEGGLYGRLATFSFTGRRGDGIGLHSASNEVL